jgi:hypothetical protein
MIKNSNIDNSSDYSHKSVLKLNNDFRIFWEEHVFWTRLFIISLIEGLPDLDATTKRLLQNPMDFEDLLRPYYGKAKAAKAGKLLREHLLLAAQLVSAAKAGNSKVADEAEKKWYKNADDIANYLSSINPYWSKKELKDMLYEHLALTKQEAVERLSKDYTTEIAVFDKIEQQALKMADTFTEGIVKQFSDKFKK